MTKQVTTWSDFVAAITTEGAEVELMNDIDCAQELPNGLDEQIDVTCSTINGGGHAIENLIISTQYGLYFTESGNNLTTAIKNFNLTNFTATTSCNTVINLHWGVIGSEVSFTDCKFSGRLLASGTGKGFVSQDASRSGWGFTQCSFNLDLGSTFFSAHGNCDSYTLYNYCNFYLTNGYAMTTAVGSTYGRLVRGQLDGCLMQGSTDSLGSGGLVYDASNSANRRHGNVINYTVINGITAPMHYGVAGTNANYCVINSGKAENTGSTGYFANTDSAFITATDAQMKEAAYLARLGFPIGV